MNLSDSIIPRLELEARKAARAVAELAPWELTARTHMRARSAAFMEAAEILRTAAATWRTSGLAECGEGHPIAQPTSAVARSIGGPA